MARKKQEAEPEVDDTIELPYNVQSLADRLEIAPASVRVKLRLAEVPKVGKMYGWRTKREFEEVAKELENMDVTAAKASAKKPKKAEPVAKPKKTLKRKKTTAESEEAAA